MLSQEFIDNNFPQVKSMRDTSGITYLDSGATNLKHIDVINSLDTYYRKETASVHRGIHTLSEHNTELYEKTRQTIKNFINAKSTEEIIYTSGTTESINLVARTWADENIKEGDEILITYLEHHSNIVPWQMLCERKKAILKVAPINDLGEILLDEFSNLITDKTKLVSFNYISNSLGTINPVREMISTVRKNSKAKILIDAAQAISHIKIDVQELDCDFLAFSGHKMFGPTGVGVLFGKKDLMENTSPLFGGGDMIDKVSFEKTTYNVLPQKFEAGTPHIAGIIAWRHAFDFISKIGFEKIQEHENALRDYAIKRLAEVSSLQIIGESKNKAAIMSFIMKGLHPHDIATFLNKYKVAVRTGHHCTQPLLARLNVPATARASFSLYNTKEDIDKLTTSLIKIQELFG